MARRSFFSICRSVCKAGSKACTTNWVKTSSRSCQHCQVRGTGFSHSCAANLERILSIPPLLIVENIPSCARTSQSQLTMNIGTGNGYDDQRGTCPPSRALLSRKHSVTLQFQAHPYHYEYDLDM